MAAAYTFAGLRLHLKLVNWVRGVWQIWQKFTFSPLSSKQDIEKVKIISSTARIKLDVKVFH